VLAAIVDVLGAAYPMGCITKSRYSKDLIHKNGPPLSRLKHGVSTGKRRAFRGERSPGWTGSVGRNWRNSGPSMLASNKESLFKGVRLSGTAGAWFLLERGSALRYTEGSEKLC